MKINILWFRRDLRPDDDSALNQALISLSGLRFTLYDLSSPQNDVSMTNPVF